MKRYWIAGLMAALMLLAGCAVKAEPAPIVESPVNMGLEEAAETALPAPTAPAETAVPEASAAPADEAVLPEAYRTILLEYAAAEQNGFYSSIDAAERDASFGADVALEWKASPTPAVYALHDFDGNGTMELVIAAGEDTARILYDLYTLDGDKAVRPLETDFGYRANLAAFGDGLIEVRYSNSAFDSGVDFYRLNGAKAEPAGSLSITSSADDPNAMQYAFNGETLSEADYTAKLASLEAAGPLDFAFEPVSALGE